LYLFTRPGSPAVEDTTNVKRGDGREIIKSHISMRNLECNLIMILGIRTRFNTILRAKNKNNLLQTDPSLHFKCDIFD